MRREPFSWEVQQRMEGMMVMMVQHMTLGMNETVHVKALRH